MLKHPNVIAAIILGASLMISAIIICKGIVSAGDHIASRMFGPSEFPNKLHIEADGRIPIRIEQDPGDRPIKVQQERP